MLEMNVVYKISQNFFWGQDHAYSALQAIGYQWSIREIFAPPVHISISDIHKLGNTKCLLVHNPVSGLYMSKSINMR